MEEILHTGPHNLTLLLVTRKILILSYWRDPAEILEFTVNFSSCHLTLFQPLHHGSPLALECRRPGEFKKLLVFIPSFNQSASPFPVEQELCSNATFESKQEFRSMMIQDDTGGPFQICNFWMLQVNSSLRGLWDTPAVCSEHWSSWRVITPRLA